MLQFITYCRIRDVMPSSYIYPFQTHTSARNYTYVRMGLHIRMCRAIHTYAWSYAYVRVAQRIGKKISMKLFGGIIG